MAVSKVIGTSKSNKVNSSRFRRSYGPDLFLLTYEKQKVVETERAFLFSHILISPTVWVQIFVIKCQEVQHTGHSGIRDWFITHARNLLTLLIMRYNGDPREFLSPSLICASLRKKGSQQPGRGEQGKKLRLCLLLSQIHRRTAHDRFSEASHS